MSKFHATWKMMYINVDTNIDFFYQEFYLFPWGIKTSKLIEQDVMVAIEKKLQYCHLLKYLAMEKPFAIHNYASRSSWVKVWLGGPIRNTLKG
jgi:hypothetical protein